MNLTVVKLGGSTAADTRLSEWIEALTQATQPLIIVPGGGPFADQVREMQTRLGFSDAAAHVMAILAMEQFGVLICDLNPRFRPARQPQDVRQAIEEGKIPVWLPSAMTIGRSDIPVSWEVTSDSLAAWLAGTIRADTILLIKQTDDFSQEDDKTTIQARGIVDEAFDAMMPLDVALFVAGPRHLAEAASLLEQGRLPGIALTTTRARSACA